MHRSASLRSYAATCICIVAFALVQPLFELVQRFPEFLSVRGLQDVRLFAFALLLSFLPGLLLGVLLWLIQRGNGPWGELLLSVVVGAGATLTALPPLWRGGTPMLLGLAVALAVGIGFGLLFERSRVVRVGIRWGWLAAAVFPAVFLFHGSVAPLWRATKVEKRSRVDGAKLDIPVAMAVFDALPLSSLLDANAEIDARQFPNFAALAGESLWFRKHTTSAERTLRSLPAMLTGRRPKKVAQPILREHPRNLFTLLEGSHELHVWEAITRLAPESAGAREVAGVLELLQDLSVLYAHAALPEPARKKLPTVDKSWRGFRWGNAGRGADSNEMVRGWREFVAGIRGEDKATLHFVHAILPHAPFLFTPTGQAYSRDGMEPSGQGDYTGVRNDDEWAAVHSYQRHLLQLAFVDQLLGEWLDALRRESIYDDALLIVTADHGVSFRRGQSGRLAGEENLPDILAVPLFLKLPGGKRGGERIERGTESIDILPTIIELLGIDTDWQMEGRSLLDESLDRQTKISLGHRGGIEATKEAASAVEHTIGEKAEWFRHGLLAPGPHGVLVGRELASFEIGRAAPGLRAHVLRPGVQFEVEEGELLPAEVVGYIALENPRATPPHLALALDGVIRAVTRPYRTTKGQANAVWSALLPEEELQAGTHSLELFLIEPEGGLARLSSAEELPSFLGRRLGDRIVVGVEETGFRRHKPHGFARFRWTEPTASFNIPLREGERPHSLRIKIVEAAPGGSTLRLRVNGTEIYAGSVSEDGFEREFSLEELSLEREILVELDSSSFVREQSVDGLPEPRVFGVALEGLWLQRRRVR